jgi:transposase
MEDVRMGKPSTSGHRPSPSVRRYSPEFKQDAVALLNSSGRSIAAVAKEVGVSDGALAAWAREQAAGLSAEDRAAAQAERKEAIQLHKRIRELEQEVEILKRFTAPWVREGGEK